MVKCSVNAKMTNQVLLTTDSFTTSSVLAREWLLTSVNTRVLIWVSLGVFEV